MVVKKSKFNESFSRTNLKVERTVSGGSVANSIVGLSQLGNKVGFIGKVAQDKFGEEYENGLKMYQKIFDINYYSFLRLYNF